MEVPRVATFYRSAFPDAYDRFWEKLTFTELARILCAEVADGPIDTPGNRCSTKTDSINDKARVEKVAGLG